MIPSALLDFDAVSDDQDEIFVQESEERGDRSIDKSMFETYARLPARFVVDVAAYVKILAAFTISVGTTMSGSEILMEACDSLSHTFGQSRTESVFTSDIFSPARMTLVFAFLFGTDSLKGSAVPAGQQNENERRANQSFNMNTAV
jgi:hypothetical protein